MGSTVDVSVVTALVLCRSVIKHVILCRCYWFLHLRYERWLNLLLGLARGRAGRTLAIPRACLASLAVVMNAPLIACVVTKIIFDTF